MTTKNKIALSLVLHNEAAHIPRLAESIKKFTIKPAGMYVTDNSSTDDSPGLIKKFFPEAHVYFHKGNPGYGTAHNINMKNAFSDGADAVFILNTDTEPGANCLLVIDEFINAHPEFGIIAPMILYGNENGKTSIIQNYRTNASLELGRINNIDEGKEIDSPDLPDFEVVNFFSGTACVITKDTFEKSGGFDETNFLYGEEMDYSYRASLNNVRIAALKDARVWHYHDWSEKNTDGRCREYYYINRNRVRYFRKFSLKKGLVFFILNEIIISPARLWWTMRKGGKKFTYYFYLGIIHGLRNKTAILSELSEHPV